MTYLLCKIKKAFSYSFYRKNARLKLLTNIACLFKKTSRRKNNILPIFVSFSDISWTILASLRWRKSTLVRVLCGGIELAIFQNMGKVRCVHWVIFFCFFVLSPFVHAQTIATAPTVVGVDYASFFKAEHSQLEEDLYSSYFAPAGRTLTAKEKIDAFIVGNFTLLAKKQYQENSTSFAEEVADARQSLKQAQAILYELYGISGSTPLERLDQEIKDSKYDLATNLFNHLPIQNFQIPGLGSVSMKTAQGVISTVKALTKIQNLEIKRKFLQAVDLELPTSTDEIRKVYVLARRISKKLPPEFSAQIDGYFEGDASVVSIQADLDALISHNPMIKNQIDLLMANGQIISLDQEVLVLGKNIEAVEMTIEQQRSEAEIKDTYLELRRGTAGVSNIIGFFNRDVQSSFNRIAGPLIDISDSYSTLKRASEAASAAKKGVKLDLNTLSACATGIGAVFALADFFIGSSRPNEMAILMEHLDSQFEKLHERFDKLHEHMDLIHKDLRKAVSDLLSVMQQRFDTTDRKLEEIRRVLNMHTEKLKVIEDLIRDQRNETRNIEMDKDQLALDQSVRRYQDGNTSLQNCLFDCEAYAEGTAGRQPHIQDSEGNQSDIRNGFFHKVLEAPYFSNLRQLLNYGYPDLPVGSEPIVGVYEDPYDLELREEGADLHQEPPFTAIDIKNIKTWADGVNTHLQQATADQKNGKIRDSGQREGILRQIDRFLLSGKKLKRSLESIFYQLDSEFEKTSVRRDFVAKLFKDYIGTLTQIGDVIENKRMQYEAEEKLSNLDVLSTEAIHSIPESVIVSDNPFSPILPSELKAALLLRIGQLMVSYDSPRWGVVDGQEGKLLFNVIFKFQEDNQEPQTIGTTTVASDQVIADYSNISPQDALNRISANDLTTLVIGQIKSRTTPTIQRQFVFEVGVVGHKEIYQTHGHGREERTKTLMRYEDICGRVQKDRSEPIYPWNGFDLSSSDIISKAEAKRQRHAEKIASDIVKDIKSESAPFERLQGQKALLEAYLSLGLNQSFANHPYLKSFFNHIFSHGLIDKEEALYFLSQPENNPRNLLKEGLLRVQKLSCLLLGTVGEESCQDEALYSAEGLLAEKMNTNELPDILNKTLRHLYRAQKDLVFTSK